MSGRVSVRVPRSYSSRNKGAFSVVIWPSKKSAGYHKKCTRPRRCGLTSLNMHG